MSRLRTSAAPPAGESVEKPPTEFIHTRGGNGGTEIGLINAAYPLADLKGEVIALARGIASKDPDALTACKEGYRHSLEMSTEAALEFSAASPISSRCIKTIPGAAKGSATSWRASTAPASADARRPAADRLSGTPAARAGRVLRHLLNRRPGPGSRQILPDPTQHRFQQLLLGRGETRQHNPVGRRNVGHHQVIELAALGGEQDAHLPPVVAVGDPTDQAAPFQIVQGVSRRGLAHTGARRQLTLRQSIFLPEDSEKLKDAHPNAMRGDSRREGSRHRAGCFGQQESERLLKPKVIETRLTQCRFSAVRCGTFLGHCNFLRRVATRTMQRPARVDNGGER